ncbi:MAG: hypothetical protein ABI151_15955 [Chitinophagaceae bacterium]
MNSLYNIIRNIFFGVFMYYAASYYGIIGTVIVSIALAVFADLIFYSYRLKVLGYFDVNLWKSIFGLWLIIIPVGLLAGWGLSTAIAHFVPAHLYFLRLVINSGLFTIFFLAFVLSIDSGLRQMAQQLLGKYGPRFFSKKVAA